MWAFINDEAFNLKGKITALGITLVGANILAWVLAYIAFHDRPLLMGTALLAYSFGLRHAVDPDHIAAIDNVTRKLMQEGKRPTTVGLFFSLGHSSIVVILSLILAVSTTALQDRFGDMKAIGGIIGTSVSALFLFGIAAANIVVLVATWRSFRKVRNGGTLADDDLDVLLAGGGLLARMFRRLFHLVRRSWHMYGLGFLFGLGFDTATEVGLLGISALAATEGLSPWTIMIFPLLFSAGMALVDTADGVVMLGAYNWAFVKPVRKLYYNLSVTFLSVVVAVVIGAMELLGLVADRLALDGPFWEAVGAVNENFGWFGYAIVGVFTLGWLASMMVYRLKGYDRIEVRS